MNKIKVLGLLVVLVTMLTSCERVAPNYQGVLMENYGKNGKEDFTLQKGRVWTMAPGTELFQVPLWEQRAMFEKPTNLLASNNTAFQSKPSYSYSIIEKRAVDVVFQNKHLGSGDDFMKGLEDNILEAKIYDILKEQARGFHTDDLMADGGQLKFEKKVEALVEAEFDKKGLKLITFTSQLEFSRKVKAKIDTRNEVNTNVTVIDQQIIEQRKQNELEALKTEQNLIRSRGLTPQILQKDFIDKWDGKSALYGVNPVQFMKTVK
jgi:hypothetical protein|tara:strand:+ start:8477 stop:9268 length:792 start_codon:yes stop_codon:yes gene_type:complete